MNLILNRDFKMPVDGWYQLAPLGEFPHAAAGVVQVVDVEACTAMVARFKADAAVENFAGLLVDFDHFSLSGERRSEAAGWITALEARCQTADNRPQTADPDGKKSADGDPPTPGSGGTSSASHIEHHNGLWAQIRWSDLGEAAVRGGRYRFLSPVWARNDCVDLGNDRVRPVRLLNAAVTNDPNLKGLVPLANSGPVDSCASIGRCDEQPASARCTGFTAWRSDGSKGKGENMKAVIERLVNHLGLGADATEAAILEKMAGLPVLSVVVDLQNSLKQAQDERDALKGTLKGVEGELVNRHLAEFEGVVTEKTKGFWTEQLVANRAGALAALGDLAKGRAEGGNLSSTGGSAGGGKPESEGSGKDKGGEAGAQGGTKKPLHNRAAARPVVPGVGGGSPAAGEVSADGRAVRIRNRAQEIVAAEKVPFIVAFRRAEREGAGQ